MRCFSGFPAAAESVYFVSIEIPRDATNIRRHPRFRPKDCIRKCQYAFFLCRDGQRKEFRALQHFPRREFNFSRLIARSGQTMERGYFFSAGHSWNNFRMTAAHTWFTCGQTRLPKFIAHEFGVNKREMRCLNARWLCYAGGSYATLKRMYGRKFVFPNLTESFEKKPFSKCIHSYGSRTRYVSPHSK